MVHTKDIPDSDGDFGGWTSTDTPCPKCGGTNTMYRTWESSCGGYEDIQFECECGNKWWVEGADA